MNGDHPDFTRMLQLESLRQQREAEAKRRKQQAALLRTHRQEEHQEMKMEKNGLVVTPWEARHLAMRLRGVAPIGFVPDDPDAERNPDDPDLLMCAASYLENGGTITVKGREKAPVQGKEPPVDTDHNPPRSLEPQAGNPMEPGRRKVRADHPDVGLTAEGPGDPDEEDDDKEPTAKKRAAPQQPKANDQPLVKRPAKVTDVDDPDEVATRRGSAPKRGN